MTSHPAPGPPPRQDGAATLRDLPQELWHDLARAFRRAIEVVEDAELPPAVRPFRGWKPDRLLADRPRRAIADALGADARLRQRLAEELGDEVRTRARTLDHGRLASELGEPRAATTLAALGRWDDLATLSANAAQRIVARQRSAAERRRRDVAGRDEDPRRLEAELVEARRERDRFRRAAEQAEARARTASAGRDELAAQVEELRSEVARLTERLREAQARQRDRLERVRRRAESAEARLRIDDERVRRAADELDALAGALRRALAGDGGDVERPAATAPASPPPEEEARDLDADRGVTPAVPRTVPAAVPGRPCRLPPGLSHDTPDGLRALLAVAGMTVVLDGYNVTKDGRGLPDAVLDDQRRWLVRVAGGVAARYHVRVVVVFDSAEARASALPASRGVIVEFATEEESADDRIAGLVAALDPQRPVVVVTSDRSLAGRCRSLGADVVPSPVFLAVAGV